jgi:hypothetical protein
MYGKADKPGTLKIAQMMCEKEKASPSDGDCMTRMMNAEDWEKYGPLITSKNKKVTTSPATIKY